MKNNYQLKTVQHKVIGIVGGMGPQAGVALLNHILCRTKATTDQEHLSAVLMSFPGLVVDRTAYLEGRTDINPAHSIAGIIDRLESAGAAVIGIACNTSHAPAIFNVVLTELKKNNSAVKLLQMPYETCLFIKQQHPQVKRVGVLSTNGTYRCGIYSDLLQDMGFELVLPDPVFQNNVIHRMVYDQQYGIKANTAAITQKVNELMQESINYFIRKGAEAIIIGCTELSLIPLNVNIGDLLIIDASDILARALIRDATQMDRSGHLFATV